MDIHLKQWRNQQHESEEHNAAKMPKLLFDPHLHSHQQKQQESSSGSDALRPLFEPQLNNKTCNLSAFPNSPTRFSGMGSYFSLAQWQELELQALIYRYMLAGAAVPPELLNTIQKSLLHSAPYFIHYPLQHYSHYQPALVQAGYWGKGSMDPEPGRCRRTDGKKWRCSRDVVTGQKYCERHVHRGRNRSRKPVELPTPTTSASGGADGGSALGSSNSVAKPGFGGGAGFTLSGQSPSIDLLKLNRGSSESKTENKVLLEAHNEVHDKADGHILRHFFDDWPPSIQQAEVGGSNASPPSSTTFLTISMPGNSSSDVSLKLSTGNGDEQCPEECEREPPLHLNWAWAGNQVASMGGPLAEALRSSTSNSSPTSVLHQLHRGSVSDKSSFVCS